MSDLEVDPRSLPIPQAYALIAGAVAPRPIAFVSSLSAQGCANLAPFSFFNVFGANPLSVCFSPLRNRHGLEKDTLRNIRETGEYVIHVVTAPMAEAMNRTSRDVPAEVSEWELGPFTPAPSRVVRPARVAESPVAMECKLFQVVQHGDGPLCANYIIGEVVWMHVADSVMREGKVDPTRVGQIARNGGAWYTRVEPQSMFELERP